MFRRLIDYLAAKEWIAVELDDGTELGLDAPRWVWLTLILLAAPVVLMVVLRYG